MNNSASISYVLSSELALTNACALNCGYCSFVSKENIDLTSIQDIEKELKRLSTHGATEVIYRAGENPQDFPEILIALKQAGFSSFIEYCIKVCELTISYGLLPVLNIGYLSEIQYKQLSNSGAVIRIDLVSTNKTGSGECMEYARSHTPHSGKMQIEFLHKESIPYSIGFVTGIGETESERLSFIKEIGEYCSADPYLQDIRIAYFQPEQKCMLKHRPPLDLQSVQKMVEALRNAFPVHFISIPPHLFYRYPELVEHGLNDLGSVPIMTSCLDHPTFPVPSYESMKSRLAYKNIHLYERESLTTNAATNREKIQKILPNIRERIIKRNESPISLIDNDLCFVCGKRNPIGLHLPTKTSIKDNTCSFTWTTGPYFQSYAGILHGGITCTLMDEAMGYAIMGEKLDKMVVTADMKVKYNHPTPIGMPVKVIATITKRLRNHIFARASIIAPDGTVLSEAEGHFVELINKNSNSSQNKN